METKPILLPEQDINFHIDFGLLRDIARRKVVLLALVGLAVGGVYTFRQQYLAPQQFVGECSIAMQQSGPIGIPSGLSALLGGGGGGSHKYMGLLASRMMAEKVEKRLNFAQRMNLGPAKNGINVLRGGLKPDDSSYEGLLIIRFMMDAPPVMARDPEHKAEQARMAVAEVANEYAAELAEFYSDSNSEGANALLKIVENERRDARENYQRATGRLRNFVASWKGKPVASTPVGGTVESNGPSDLMSLYGQIDQLDTEMRSTRIAQEESIKLRNEQVKNLKILPAEDTLLNAARNRVATAESAFRRVEDAYNPEARQYKEAADVLRHAKEDLAQQLKGIQKLQTSDQVDMRKNLAVQQDRRASLAKQIAKAEENLFSRRDLAWRMEQLRTDQGIAQQRMQAAEVKAVDVRLSTLTGKSKISILDPALPPDSNAQGNASPTRMSILLGLFAMGFVTALEYMRAIRRRSLNAYQFALSTAGRTGNGLAHSDSNGNGSHAAGKSNGAAVNGNSIVTSSVVSEIGNGAYASEVPEEIPARNANGKAVNTNGNGNAAPGSGGSNGHGNGSGKHGSRNSGVRSSRRR